MSIRQFFRSGYRLVKNLFKGTAGKDALHPRRPKSNPQSSRPEKELEDAITRIIKSRDRAGLYLLRRFYWDITPEAYRCAIPAWDELLKYEEISDINLRLNTLIGEMDRYIRMSKDAEFSARTPPYDYFMVTPIQNSAYTEVLQQAVEIIAGKYSREEEKILIQSFSIGDRCGIWFSNQHQPLNIEVIKRALNR